MACIRIGWASEALADETDTDLRSVFTGPHETKSRLVFLQGHARSLDLVADSTRQNHAPIQADHGSDASSLSLPSFHPRQKDGVESQSHGVESKFWRGVF